jgi:hypothetical protein
MDRTYLDLEHLVAERRAELVRAGGRPRRSRLPTRWPLRRRLAALCFSLASWLDARYVVAQHVALERRGRFEVA